MIDANESKHKQPLVCEGRNCRRSDGTHSKECLEDFEKSFNWKRGDYDGVKP